ncbi:MAG TPA: hypothetical protein VFC29_10580 [Candidatus Limnocylindrales bacterium]|nr:hypothetical protein [Candidatus Limnocylindrales bacterium]
MEYHVISNCNNIVNLTLQLLWEEYRQAHPEGYRYSWFCERYQRWRRHLDVVLRQEHKAGEKMFVDWAGATIPVYDATTGQPGSPPLTHDNVRGAEYFDQGGQTSC